MTTHTAFIFGDEYLGGEYKKLHYVAGNEYIQLQGDRDTRNLLPEDIDALIMWLTGCRQQIDNARKEGKQ